ncbi:S-adenosyl-L-methionine-dependent methyltransferase [Mycena maculata]|uniref:S-adenosyl-L-methionine-dependent methyltransferase n=1 Tax=Mycena maculata TaxID=230809 RepID=A0AAD7I5Z2_9AGAR|nr:S-adenosyl-L-methionine-dependent methyltransferase [Mycena maculata]
MKFSAIFEIVDTMRVALMLGIPSVFRAAWASPSLLFNPAALSRISMASIWISFSQGDAHAQGDKEKLITPYATGVVLDLGAGHGHTVNYLDRTKVTKYIAVEPNTLMYSYIREKAQTSGYSEDSGSLILLSCGAEDTVSIMSSAQAKVDTIVSVLTFCTVPAPQETLRSLVQDVLAPGGQLIIYEHVLSRRADVAWWQSFWTPVWSKVLDGCCLNRPTDVWLKEMLDDSGKSLWAEAEIWNPSDFEGNDSEDDWFRRQLGRFVKK